MENVNQNLNESFLSVNTITAYFYTFFEWRSNSSVQLKNHIIFTRVIQYISSVFIF